MVCRKRDFSPVDRGERRGGSFQTEWNGGEKAIDPKTGVGPHIYLKRKETS